jgi:hypothetical protein
VTKEVDRLMVARLQREKEREREKREKEDLSRVRSLYLLPPFLLKFPPSPNNAIMLGIHQGINVLIRSNSSGSNHFPKAHHLAAKPMTHEPSRTFQIQTIAGKMALEISVSSTVGD